MPHTPIWMALALFLVQQPARDEAACLRAVLSASEAAGFSGAALVAEGDTILLQAEAGDAARDGRETAFWIASISKAVTAVAAMKLVEDGHLELDAPISRYLPGVPEAHGQITLHDLLAHRSGLAEGYRADGVADRATAASRILSRRPAKAIGQFEYTNDGYALVAMLIEIASKQSFEDYVTRAVLEPAGMTSTGFWGFEPDESPVAPVAKPGRARSTRATIWRDGRSVANWGYRGPTGIYSVPADLFRLVRALQDGRVLQPSTFALMLSPKNPDGGPMRQTYGYGFGISFEDGRLVEYRHGGNEDWLGHTGMLRVVGNRTYVVLANSGDRGDRSWAASVEEDLRACRVPQAP